MDLYRILEILVGLIALGVAAFFEARRRRRSDERQKKRHQDFLAAQEVQRKDSERLLKVMYATYKELKTDRESRQKEDGS